MYPSKKEEVNGIEKRKRGKVEQKKVKSVFRSGTVLRWQRLHHLIEKKIRSLSPRSTLMSPIPPKRKVRE